MNVSSTYVEIGIGLCLLFALLSFVASLAGELLSRALSWRARLLEEGIVGLLHDVELTRRLFRHPLVQGLSRPGRVWRYLDVLRRRQHSAREWLAARRGKPSSDRLDVWLERRSQLLHKPSYIPSKVFAEVLLDLVRPGRQLRAGLLRLRLPLPLPKDEDLADGEPWDRSALRQQIEMKIRPHDERDRLLRLFDATYPEDGHIPLLGEEIATGIPLLRTAPLREALSTLFLRRARSRHTRSAGSGPLAVDVDQAHAALASWFDDAMDRVTGWYKRRMQLAVQLVAGAIVLSLNVDAFYMADRIARDEALRRALVGDAAALRTEGLPKGDTETEDTGTLALRVAELTVELGKLGLPLGWPARDEVDEVALEVSKARAALAGTEEARDVRLAELALLTQGAESAAQSLDAARKAEREALLAARRAAVADAGLAAEGDKKKGEARATALAKAQHELAQAELTVAEAVAKERRAEEERGRVSAEGAERSAAEASSRFDKARAALRDLRIRRLETLEQEIAVVGEGWTWFDRNEPIVVRVFGWLVAALAATLGAQFWFDALSRLVTVRDAGKKPPRAG